MGSDFAVEFFLQQIAVAVLRIHAAVAKQRHRNAFAELLPQAQSEFLAVVLDRLVALVD